MGIFGDLDIDEIPDNPFWVKAGDYLALVSNAYFTFSEKKNVNQLVICYTISSEDSDYYGAEVRDYFDYYPDINKETLQNLPGDERRKIVGALSAIKRRLCGQPDQKRRGLGVDPADLDGKWEPNSIVGLEVELGVVNRGENDEYTNVSWANLVG